MGQPTRACRSRNSAPDRWRIRLSDRAIGVPAYAQNHPPKERQALETSIAVSTGATYDAIIIGGGPAGLSAALVLGRCRRRVLLCDAGQQRNRSSHAMHGYLTRDGIPPSEFLKIAFEE